MSRMMGWTKNGPKTFFKPNFVRQMFPPKQKVYLLDLSVLHVVWMWDAVHRGFGASTITLQHYLDLDLAQTMTWAFG